MTTLPPHASRGKGNLKTTFIYALVDPNTQQVRYVGKSNNPQVRLYRHFKEKGHTYKNRWLQSLRERGLTPEIRILEEAPVSQWQERERYWIAFYREQGLDLANGTDGGDGVHGMRHTDEAKAKIGAASKGNQHGKGYKLTPEQKARQVAALKGHAVKPDTGEKIAATKRGKPRSEETKAKMSAAFKGKPLDDERKARMRGRKHSEETKAKQSDALKGRKLSEEHIAKLKGRKHSEESKARMSAAQRAIPRIYTEERRAAMREEALKNGRRPPSRKGMPMSAEAIEKRKATLLAKNSEAMQERRVLGEAIRADYRDGMKVRQLIEKYRISQTQVWRVIRGEAWL